MKKKWKKKIKDLEERLARLEEPRVVTEIGFKQLSNMCDENDYDDYEDD